MSSMLGCHHPTIYKFITELKKHQVLTDTKLEKLNAGELVSTMRTKYKKAAEKLKRVVEGFLETPILDYLREVAHNIELAY